MRERAVQLYLKEHEGSTANDADLHINHMDGSKVNNHMHILELTIIRENSGEHRVLMMQAVEDGAEVLKLKNSKTCIDGALTSLICMTDNRHTGCLESDLFGDFFAPGGINSALIDGRPAAMVYAEQLDALDLPVGCEGVVVRQRGGRYKEVAFGGTVWQDLDALYKARAHKILGTGTRLDYMKRKGRDKKCINL
jgi:hypothetical protein